MHKILNNIHPIIDNYYSSYLQVSVHFCYLCKITTQNLIDRHILLAIYPITAYIIVHINNSPLYYAQFNTIYFVHVFYCCQCENALYYTRTRDLDNRIFTGYSSGGSGGLLNF